MGLFSGIASIFGGGAQKKASRAAEQAQLNYLGQAMTGLNDQQLETDARFAPYEDSGAGALAKINALLGINTPGTVDFAAYVAGNPDLAAEWNRIKDEGRFQTPEDYGRWHYETRGQTEGRDVTAFSSGATGDGSQAAAIAELENSPLFQALMRNGEEGILQNASATGGLRGGNIQRGLADFRSDTLTKTIENQLQRLGGLSGAGLSAAGASSQMGANTAGQTANIFGQQGQVRAGGLLTRGGITAGQFGNVGGILDQVGKGVMGGGNIGSILKGLF